jgi:hypothetical protein
MERDEAQRRFEELAAELEFDRKYFALIERTRPRRPGVAVPFCERAQVLAQLGRRFSYHRGEKFYKVFAPDLPPALRLHLGLEYGGAELIAVVETPAGGVGGVFSGLARDIAELRDPTFTPDPPYPRPWFRDADELTDVLRDGYALLDELAAAVLRSDIPLKRSGRPRKCD